MTDEDAVLAAERAVWDALKAGDPAADRALLAERFLGVYPDGFAGRDAHAAQLSDGPSIRSYRIEDTRFLQLGPDHMLIAYCAEYQRAGRDRPERMMVSSVWERRGATWVGVFSQDTPLTDTPAP